MKPSRQTSCTKIPSSAQKLSQRQWSYCCSPLSEVFCGKYANATIATLKKLKHLKLHIMKEKTGTRRRSKQATTKSPLRWSQASGKGLKNSSQTKAILKKASTGLVSPGS